MTHVWPVVNVVSSEPLNVYYCLANSRVLTRVAVNPGEERELPLGTPSWRETRLEFHLVVRDSIFIARDALLTRYTFQLKTCHNSICEVSISLFRGEPRVTCGAELCKRIRSRRQLAAPSSSE